MAYDAILFMYFEKHDTRKNESHPRYLFPRYVSAGYDHTFETLSPEAANYNTLT